MTVILVAPIREVRFALAMSGTPRKCRHSGSGWRRSSHRTTRWRSGQRRVERARPRAPRGRSSRYQKRRRSRVGDRAPPTPQGSGFESRVTTMFVLTEHLPVKRANTSGSRLRPYSSS